MASDKPKPRAKSGNIDEDQRWLVEKYGARPAKGSLADWLKERGPLGPVDPNNPTPGTDALQKIREDRV